MHFVKEKEFHEFIKENPGIKEFVKDKQELLSPKIFEKQENELERSISELVKVLDSEPYDRLKQEQERQQVEGRRSSCRSRRNSLERVLEGEGGRRSGPERVSPLEEFNTLHRFHSGVRASIKLKESDLV